MTNDNLLARGVVVLTGNTPGLQKRQPATVVLPLPFQAARLLSWAVYGA